MKRTTDTALLFEGDRLCLCGHKPKFNTTLVEYEVAVMEVAVVREWERQEIERRKSGEVILSSSPKKFNTITRNPKIKKFRQLQLNWVA